MLLKLKILLDHKLLRLLLSFSRLIFEIRRFSNMLISHLNMANIWTTDYTINIECFVYIWRWIAMLICMHYVSLLLLILSQLLLFLKYTLRCLRGNNFLKLRLRIWRKFPMPSPYHCSSSWFSCHSQQWWFSSTLLQLLLYLQLLILTLIWVLKKFKFATIIFTLLSNFV